MGKIDTVVKSRLSQFLRPFAVVRMLILQYVPKLATSQKRQRLNLPLLTTLKHIR